MTDLVLPFSGPPSAISQLHVTQERPLNEYDTKRRYLTLTLASEKATTPVGLDAEAIISLYIIVLHLTNSIKEIKESNFIFM